MRSELDKLLIKYWEKVAAHEGSVEYGIHGEVISQDSSALAWATRYAKQAIKIMTAQGLDCQQIADYIGQIKKELDSE